MNENEYLKIVTPFKDKVFRVAKRLLVSIEEAEDATQEVFLKLWKHRQKLKDYNSPEAFAMTITKNWCFDRLKSKQAQNLKIVHNNYEDHSQSLQQSIEVNPEIEATLSQTALPVPNAPPNICLVQAVTFSDL